MYFIFVVLLFSQYFVANTSADIERHIKTLHGNKDPPFGLKNTVVLNAENAEIRSELSDAGQQRYKRAAGPIADTVSTKINHLNDTHKQLMVHWVGEKSKVVICLARDPAPIYPEHTTVNPSAVYISYDDGDSYENKTNSFKLSNGSFATLEKFYNHPKYNTHFVFTDIRHNLMYVTIDYGKNFHRLELNFTASDVSFHELLPSTFVVLDKNDTNHKFWITEDFGQHFRLAHEFVESFYWMQDANKNQQLIVQRYEPSGLSSIIYSKNLFKSRASQIYTTNVKDFFFKGDYLFTTKNNAKGGLDLYVSYKLGRQVLCVFNSVETLKSFYIVDVTGSRAFIAASHSNTSSNLYVSENLGGNDGVVKFTLSLEDVFAYFPNTTFQETWLHHASEDAFADVYKVEGLSGIYIASKVAFKPIGNTIGPQNLVSVITFDHGATWRRIQPPAEDVENQSTACLIMQNNCSLHLSQKFSQLHPDTRSVSILSSKSAPGIIVATGVLGQSLKGHLGVYISLDAGLTWRQTLRELYFFNMGDHGGILTAVKYYKNKGETRHIRFSVDEGAHWNETVFHNEDIRLYGLMTEPGENTTVFTMFGSLPEAHQWIIVKVDFQKVFNRTCTKDDYKMWSPSQSDENRSYIPCVLGEQTTYQRRMPLAQCLNGLDYIYPIKKQVCDCDYLDYECDFGFIKTGKPHRCIRDKTYPAFDSYDPYKVPANCKPGQFYNRTKGYRKISGDMCIGGFESHYLPDQVPCPFQEVQDFILFAQKERISRFNLITNKLDEELPVKNLKNVIAIDFDMEANCVYWADIALDTINRQCFGNGSKVEVLVASDLSSIEGMALDWISKTLYFVDGVRSKIELIRTNISHSGRMRRTILDSRTLYKPRGIALHPQNGYMFWTDWSVENPSVNRANLDGSNNVTLFGRDKVEWPNGITIDYIANRIYWVDARLDYIGSSDLHGDGFLKVVSDIEVVSHPFAIAVFKNNMYWDDWKRHSIFSADKDNFRGVDVIVKQLPGLMDLKIFAQGIQIGKNACANSNCSSICVGMPKNKFACLCPDGLTMKNGKCMCPGNVEPLTTMTCPPVGNSCSVDHYTCTNGLCVPKGWRCDGEDDCGDNSDERLCGSQTCPSSFHTCGDGKCLPHYWKCDYDMDCSDGSDEQNCPKQNCTDGQYACDNGRCISSKWKCDGENDCRDGSDERNCNPDKPSSCKNDEYQCKSGAITCIPSTWKCDGEPDCRDGSDELDCKNNTCAQNQFSCGPPNNRCIYNTWVCDGDRDCADGKDEKNCTVIVPITDLPKAPNHFVPTNGTCQDWMFKCQNERCIPFWWKCDTADDCGDNSDELGCPNMDNLPPMPSSTSKTQPACENNQYQCLTGDCIFSSWVCDNMYDCPGGEDESNCDNYKNCTVRQFKCKMDGSCISLNSVCDGDYDCPDGTDELSCEHNFPNGPATPSCSVGLFPCDGGSCYPSSVLCDGKIDCKDGYDETNCSKKSRIYQVMQMKMDERDSDDTSLWLGWQMSEPKDVKFEYLPAICKVGEDKWKNESWTENYYFRFLHLHPFTKYNMTVYVRIQNTTTAFPPAKYFIASTSEGWPSEPWNVTVKQRNGSHVLVSWRKPLQPNGIIANYEICWNSQNSSDICLLLTGNETSHLLSPEFQHGVAYTFWVIAHNKKYQSNQSHPVEIQFDGETNVSFIKELKVHNVTDESISLIWIYEGDADGFNVVIHAERPYPDIPPKITKTNNITMKLAPGADYRFEINAFKKELIGPVDAVSVSTTGTPLPKINTVQAMLLKEVGTTVKLSWERPKYSKKVNWIYGVYYGVNQEQLFKKAMLNTLNETATVTNLNACENYMFAVGLVGPIGYGPLLPRFVQVSTSINDKAPPKKIQVGIEGDNPLRMRVQWLPSCPSSQPKSYMIKVKERSTTKPWTVGVNGTLFYVFNVSYGGVYDVSVATLQSNFSYSKPVTYYAPPIQPPFKIQVISESNGSYIVYWQERELPPSTGPYFYEVLVQEGNTLNETTAQTFVVNKPPFIFTNLSGSTFTFAVRIRTGKGLKSVTSQLISKRIEMQTSSANLPAIIIPSLLVLIALLAVITFLVVRNRRLQSSFTRFANSHYDTRSEAATFDDSSLEEDESPHIRGFSDDEPLVIA